VRLGLQRGRHALVELIVIKTVGCPPVRTLNYLGQVKISRCHLIVHELLLKAVAEEHFDVGRKHLLAQFLSLLRRQFGRLVNGQRLLLWINQRAKHSSRGALWSDVRAH